MKHFIIYFITLLFVAGCGVLDSGEDEIEGEEFLPFTAINNIIFTEDEAIISATITKPNPCYQYVSTNILLKDGEYFFAARGFNRGGICTQQLVDEQIQFNVRLLPYGQVSFNFLNYDNVYIDTLVVPGN
ncbi:MAG: hypothetical protein SCALA702_23420 [Melioribacteraceae bacterium]|nr:MAG: hypothetical protein SCALA702_23420 [Melioribacteraceae bacterium]